MTRTYTLAIEIGNEELLVAVTYNYVSGQSATHSDPEYPAEIDVEKAVFLLTNSAHEVPDCILSAIQNDVQERGPIWDELMYDVLSDPREYER